MAAAAPGGTNADDLMEYGRPTCNATTGRRLYVLALKVARRGPGERGSEERGYCTDFFFNFVCGHVQLHESRLRALPTKT